MPQITFTMFTDQLQVKTLIIFLKYPDEVWTRFNRNQNCLCRHYKFYKVTIYQLTSSLHIKHYFWQYCMIKDSANIALSENFVFIFLFFWISEILHPAVKSWKNNNIMKHSVILPYIILIIHIMVSLIKLLPKLNKT